MAANLIKLKNNNYLVLLLAILCFTVLPSFTIVDEDITIPETEINVELEEFVTELRAELVRFSEEINVQFLKYQFIKKHNMAHPNDPILVYPSSNSCGGTPWFKTFGYINSTEGLDEVCTYGGAIGSYEYEVTAGCIVIHCGSGIN